MVTSLFIAKLLGLYLSIISVLLLVKKDFFMTMIEDFLTHPALLAFQGAINIFSGLILILVHNVWIWSWPVVITLFGYFLLFRGIFIFLCPETAVTWGKKMQESKKLPCLGIILLLLGLWLSYVGFFSA